MCVFLFPVQKRLTKKRYQPELFEFGQVIKRNMLFRSQNIMYFFQQTRKEKKDYSGFYATCFVEVSDLIVHIFQYPQSIQSQYINTRIDDCVRSGSYRHALRQRWFHLWILQAFQTLKPHGGKKANVMLHFYGVRQLEGCSTREMFRGSKLPWLKIRQFNLTVTSTFI